MSRYFWLATACAFSFAIRAWAGPVEYPTRLPEARTAKDVQKHLHQPVALDGFEPNTPLREALGFISEHFGVRILMDTTAFRDDLGIMEPEQQPLKLPKMVGVPLHTVLQLLTAQAQGAVVQIGGVLWVVPPHRARERVLRQQVGVDFDKEPLRKALTEVADQTGFTIVLDQRRAAEAADARVSGNFQGVGLEGTVRTLADMAGLKAILVGDIYYVTTEEHANELAQEEKQRQREQKEQQKTLEDDKAKKEGKA